MFQLPVLPSGNNMPGLISFPIWTMSGSESKAFNWFQDTPGMFKYIGLQLAEAMVRPGSRLGLVLRVGPGI